jgi:hypothetical protein
LEALDRHSPNVRDAPSLEALLAVTDAAAGYQRAFHRVKDVSDRAGSPLIDSTIRALGKRVVGNIIEIRAAAARSSAQAQRL